MLAPALSVSNENAKSQVIAAIGLLYSASDPKQQKEADAWLISWQQTSEAWQISDIILSQEDMPVSHRIFAAQTFRNKVQLDFNGLKCESCTGLKQSLMCHICKFRDPQFHAIHKQLAVAIADLVIQMDIYWQDPIASLFDSFGSTPDSYSTLVEILKMLPEENANEKLVADAHKRANNRQVLQQSVPRVFQFLLAVPCPSMEAKRQVLECFLSWVKFTQLDPNGLAQNPLFLGAFNTVTEGSELSEVATDIVVEVLSKCSQDLRHFEPVIIICIQQLAGLKDKFEKLMAYGEQALLENQDVLQQICRIYTEAGDSLLPWIMEQHSNPEVIAILKILYQCMSLADPEINRVPLEFWRHLASEICRLSEEDAKVRAFRSIFVEVFKVIIHQCKMPTNSDPFAADDDRIAHRKNFLEAAEDCTKVLTPSGALEHVLQGLQQSQTNDYAAQEAHFSVLVQIGPMLVACDGSVLRNLIQPLPQLISSEIQEHTVEAAFFHFTKKAAIDLFGSLRAFVGTNPDLFRSSLSTITAVFMQPMPQHVPAHVLGWIKQIQQSASMALREICSACAEDLQDLMPHLSHLYTSTMQLPIRIHLFIIEGICSTITHFKVDDAFKQGIGQLVSPLVAGLQTEQNNPIVIGQILDRLTTIIRLMKVQVGSPRAAIIGECIEKTIWPLIRQTLMRHSSNEDIAEKACRALKHSMSCVCDSLKPIVPELAELLAVGFQQNLYSSYLFLAEILAKTYAGDAAMSTILTSLFNKLSGIALQILLARSAELGVEGVTELVEDFYGMLAQYTRYMPAAVLAAPTLQPAMELCSLAIVVQHKGAMTAVVTFLEVMFELAADNKYGEKLQPYVMKISEDLMKSIFQMIAQVPTPGQQEIIPRVLVSIRHAVGRDMFHSWLQQCVAYLLPESCLSDNEKCTVAQQVGQGDFSQVCNVVQDICRRCEQIVLRNRTEKNQVKAKDNGILKQTTTFSQEQTSTWFSCRGGDCALTQCLELRCRAAS